jgi:hypothetical protein
LGRGRASTAPPSTLNPGRIPRTGPLPSGRWRAGENEQSRRRTSRRGVRRSARPG